jgi:hypothetical protein
MIPVLLAFSTPVNFQFGVGVPTIITVEPDSAKVGSVMEAHGSNLDREAVAALYLCDGKSNIPVVILEQSATAIRFRIPFNVKPGRYALVVVAAGREHNLIQEPVRVLIEPATS